MAEALLMNACDENKDQSLSFKEVQDCYAKLPLLDAPFAPISEEIFNKASGDDGLLTLEEWQNPKPTQYVQSRSCCVCLPIIGCVGLCCP